MNQYFPVLWNLFLASPTWYNPYDCFILEPIDKMVPTSKKLSNKISLCIIILQEAYNVQLTWLLFIRFYYFQTGVMHAYLSFFPFQILFSPSFVVCLRSAIFFRANALSSIYSYNSSLDFRKMQSRHTKTLTTPLPTLPFSINALSLKSRQYFHF